MTTLQDAVDELVSLVVQIPGIRRGTAAPPEQLPVFPFAVGYAQTGTWKMGPIGAKTGLHNIVIEVHSSREQDLARAYEEAVSFSDSVPNAIFLALQNATLTTLQTFEDITYTFGPLGWGGKATIGFQFTVRNCKMQSAIT